MLLNTTALLLFSPQQPTTLQFPSAIEYYAIGHTVDFESYLTKNKKILLIRPKKQKFDEFLVVITKERSYQFQVKSTNQKITAFYHIHAGKREKFYTLKKATDSYKVFEGRRSFKIERIKGAYLVINGQRITQKTIYYPKNAFLSINGEEVQ